jgi:hypothetical protein
MHKVAQERKIGKEFLLENRARAFSYQTELAMGRGRPTLSSEKTWN